MERGSELYKSPADPFAPGDTVQCVDVEDNDALHDIDISGLRLWGVYTVSDCGPRCLWCGARGLWLAEVTPSGWYDSRRFRLVSRPDPEVKAEPMEVCEPRPLVEAMSE